MYGCVGSDCKWFGLRYIHIDLLGLTNVFNCGSVTRCVLVPELRSTHKLRNSVSNLDNE